MTKMHSLLLMLMLACAHTWKPEEAQDALVRARSAKQQALRIGDNEETRLATRILEEAEMQQLSGGSPKNVATLASRAEKMYQKGIKTQRNRASK